VYFRMYVCGPYIYMPTDARGPPDNVISNIEAPASLRRLPRVACSSIFARTRWSIMRLQPAVPS